MEIWLEDDDMDRLFEIKKKQNKNDLSVIEFARELLEAEIYRLHPSKVINPDEFI